MTRRGMPFLAASRFREGRIFRWARSPEAPKMTRSTPGPATDEILKGDHVGPRDLIGEILANNAQRQRRQPQQCLAGGRPRAIRGDDTLIHDRSAERAAGRGPAGEVVAGGNPEQESETPAASD